jgi:hypothetical protein
VTACGKRTKGRRSNLPALFACAAPLMLAACDPTSRVEISDSNGVASTENLTSQNAGSIANRTGKRVSTYTKLSEENCELVDENREEGPYWLRRCTGPDGWIVEWGESDLRQGLTLGSASGTSSDLELSDKVANGAFNTLGPAIEWRGEAGRSADVLIVRMDVTDNANPERPPKSRLAVARLTPSPCVVAIVDPGPGQNETARELADGELPECLLD